MPSVGRIKKLSALGVAAIAALGVYASSASANDVWLWACHGPNGQALSTDPFHASEAYSARIFAYGDECADGEPGGLGGGGLSAVLSERAGDPPANQPVQGWSQAWLRLDVPPSMQLKKVRIQRATRGFSQEGSTAGNPQSYALTTAGGELESVSLADESRADKTGEATFDVASTTGGDFVQARVFCDNPPANPCAAADPVELDVSRVGMLVSDTTAPKAAVGGTSSPVAGKMTLKIPATDAGSGLKEVVVNFGNLPAQTVQYGGVNCEELSPGDSTVDLPLDARCTKVDTAGATVELNLGKDVFGNEIIADGDYDLRVRVYDWAGNVYEEPVRRIQVLNNPPRGTNTQDLNIGTSNVQQPGTDGSTPGDGGVAGASTQRCSSPRLSMFLSQKPLRVRRGVPVLKAGKRYRFNGRLTCVINGRRVSAPKRARIDIINRVGNRTLEKAGTTVRDRGNLTVILAYKTSRRITFRFTNTDGRTSQVHIRIRTARR